MLSKESSIPLYQQVKTELLNDIESSVYKVGETIPTETQLEEIYKTSRITIRKAVKELVEQGVLLKKQGKGTFVQAHKVKRNLLDLGSYTTYMEESGKQPSAVVQSLNVQSADSELAEKLKVAEGTDIIVLERTMKLEDGDAGYEVSYYAFDKYPGLVTKIHDLTSVTQILNNDYHVFSSYSEQTINVIFAAQQLAEYMEMENGAPLYQVSRIVNDQNDAVMYYAVMYYDVNKVSFSVNTKER